MNIFADILMATKIILYILIKYTQKMRKKAKYVNELKKKLLLCIDVYRVYEIFYIHLWW